MASQKQPSKKRLQIDKAQASTVVFLAVAAFVTVFSLVASRALLGQRSYQSRVITEKKKALAQLESNNKAAIQLVGSYKVFVASPENIIGGSSNGTGDRDGDNAKITLDSLPSKYDFPALASSMEKILSERKYQIGAITGTDDELNQSSTANATVKPVEMPFVVTTTGNFDAAQGVLELFQRSIRPIQILSLSLSGADDTLNVSLNAKTYYQPQKTVQITKQVIK